MIAIWPSSIRQLPQRGDWDGGPRDDRAIFEPESGPPILRRRVTGVTSEFSATFPKLRAAQVTAFEAWFQDDLANGSLPFLFRDPVRGDVARWMIPGGNGRPYSYRANGADLHDLSMTLLRMPGNAAVAPYVVVQADGSLRAPHVVADYDAGVFLIDGVSVSASSVVAIAGTYDVLTVIDPVGSVWDYGSSVVAGDIPASAPMDAILVNSAGNAYVDDAGSVYTVGPSFGGTVLRILAFAP